MSAKANDAELTIWEHLEELRSRLLKAMIALIVATMASVVFTKRALEILIAPLGEHVPQTISPTESFLVYFRIALIGGLVLAMPVIVYQAIRFVLPGLLPHEQKYLYFLIPGATICFAGGVAFAALIMLPAAINLDHYISFVTRVLFWMGVIFQTPLVMFFLAKLGLVTPKKLTRARKYAVLATAIVAAVVTPTPDPINMMIVMLPLYLLYEVGIILARVATIGRKAKEEEQEGEETAQAG